MVLLYVLGFALFIVAVWQAYLRSSHYKIIGSVAALFLIGVILVLFGVEDLGKFLIFLFESWYLLMLLLILSGKFKYYLKYLKLFIFLYAVSVALLLWSFDIKYFWLYLLLSGAFFYFNLKLQLDKKDEDRMFSHIQFETLHGIDKKINGNKDIGDSKIKRFFKNHLYMGTTVFLLSLLVAHFIFNGGF